MLEIKDKIETTTIVLNDILCGVLILLFNKINVFYFQTRKQFNKLEKRII